MTLGRHVRPRIIHSIKATGAVAVILAHASVCVMAWAAPKTEALWPQGAPGAVGNDDKDRPKLIIHVPDADRKCSAAIVILPGGGYGGLAMGHEGHEIAAWFNKLGVTAFICDYRHRGKGYGHPSPLQDAQRAIRTARSRAEEFGIDPTKIGVIGFSAGGHLASSTATHFDDGESQATDPVQRVSCRPDFAILCYPVIAFAEPHTHRGSQRNLLGGDPDPKLVQQLSTEKQVTANTPPTFLWHTSADRVVPPENSIYFYLALRKAKVPAELHIYEHGRHGLGLARQSPAVSSWPRRCEDWLRGQGILPKAPR